MIYNCGWWCRDNNHLQMWEQGITPYNTLKESWPGYRVITYMDGELMSATVEVIGSSCTRIIGKFLQNLGNTEMHITSVVRLGITSYAVPNGLMIDNWLNVNSWLTPFPHHSTLPLWWTIHRWHASTLQRACVLIVVESSRTIQTVSQ